jgi:hypothetical protein
VGSVFRVLAVSGWFAYWPGRPVIAPRLIELLPGLLLIDCQAATVVRDIITAIESSPRS